MSAGAPAAVVWLIFSKLAIVGGVCGRGEGLK